MTARRPEERGVCVRSEEEEEEVGTFVEFYLRGRLLGVKCARAGAGVAALGCGARTWFVRPA